MNILKLKKIKISKEYSFDVFDTCVTRAVGEPKNIFYILALQLNQKNVIKVAPDQFENERKKAETQAHQEAGNRSVKLDVIYEYLQKNMDWTSKIAKRAMDEELELEAKLLYPIEETKEYIARIIRQGKKPIYISDMYLHTKQLMSLLRKKNYDVDDERLFVSSETGDWKYTGELFKVATKSIGLAYEDVHHTGDHEEADLKGPKKIGATSELFTEAHLNRYEKIIQKYNNETGGLASLFAGASRVARLNTRSILKNDKSIVEVATGVAAPLLVSFILWVFQKSREKGIKNLYFMTRDGQILYEIALMLNQKLKYSFNLKLLYGSRQSCAVPPDKEEEKWNIEWTRYDDFIPTIDHFLKRLELESQDLRVNKIMRRHGITFKMQKKYYSNAKWQKLTGVLLADSDFQNLVREKAVKKQKLVEKYFRQEGMRPDVKNGFVDVGWSGHIQYAMEKSYYDVEGFYLGIRRNPISVGKKQAYLYDQRDPSDNNIYKYGDTFVFISEAFTSSCIKKVDRYEKQKGKVKPIFTFQSHRAYEEWGVKKMREAILKSVECLHLELLENPFQEMRPMVTSLYNEFVRKPTLEEARAWGAYPFDPFQTEGWCFPLAPPHKLMDFISYLVKGGYYRVWLMRWAEGSLVQTPLIPRKLMGFSSRIVRVRRKIEKKFRRFKQKNA